MQSTPPVLGEPFQLGWAAFVLFAVTFMVWFAFTCGEREGFERGFRLGRSKCDELGPESEHEQ